MARYSSGSVAIRIVLPVLWMTSRLAVVGATLKRGGRTTVKRLPRAALRYRGEAVTLNDLGGHSPFADVDAYECFVLIAVARLQC